MSETAHQVELVEMRAEHRARHGMSPDPGDTIIAVMDRYPGHHIDPQLLSLRYWMHYAAGVKHPDEATDVTLRRWLRDD
jgi:hypothetical protein